MLFTPTAAEKSTTLPLTNHHSICLTFPLKFSVMNEWAPTINLGALKTAVQWRFIDKYFSEFPRSKLKNKDFSIICNNCIAGGIYHKLGLQYSTPTVGLFFYPRTTLNFSRTLNTYLKQPLKFRETSDSSPSKRARKTKRYPIGVLGDEVEIQFMHYKER